MTNETKKLIISWRERANKCEDAYIKFIIYYMCLDAWLSEKAQSSSDTEKNKWLISNIDNSWLDDNSVHLKSLARLNPVRDMRPDNSEPKSRDLTDIKDKDGVINYIYQIRCNLFHGSKQAGIERNDNLINYSYPILEEWVGKILKQK